MLETNPGHREDITDILTPENIRAGKFKVGQVLVFEDDTGTRTKIKIKYINKGKGFAYGEHVKLVKEEYTKSHYSHEVDTSDPYSVPYCIDCEVPVDQMATPQGVRKATEKDLKRLADGTEIPDDLEEEEENGF